MSKRQEFNEKSIGSQSKSAQFICFEFRKSSKNRVKCREMEIAKETEIEWMEMIWRGMERRIFAVHQRTWEAQENEKYHTVYISTGSMMTAIEAAPPTIVALSALAIFHCNSLCDWNELFSVSNEQRFFLMVMQNKCDQKNKTQSCVFNSLQFFIRLSKNGAPKHLESLN